MATTFAADTSCGLWHGGYRGHRRQLTVVELRLSGILTVFFYARLWRLSGVLTDVGTETGATHADGAAAGPLRVLEGSGSRAAQGVLRGGVPPGPVVQQHPPPPRL